MKTAFVLISIGALLSYGPKKALSQEPIDIANSQSIEVGVLYGQLLWNALATPFSPASEYHRNRLVTYPTARIGSRFGINDWLSITPLLGYSRLGGKARKLPGGYEDEFKLHALQVATTVNYHYSVAELYIGVGVEYLFDIRQRSYDPGIGEWHEQDHTIFLKNLASSLGIGARVNVSHWFVSSEGWFGVTPLHKPELSDRVSIRQNNFRLLLGYRLF